MGRDAVSRRALAVPACLLLILVDETSASILCRQRVRDALNALPD
jgi:hypothetical protein